MPWSRTLIGDHEHGHGLHLDYDDQCRDDETRRQKASVEDVCRVIRLHEIIHIAKHTIETAYRPSCNLMVVPSILRWYCTSTISTKAPARNLNLASALNFPACGVAHEQATTVKERTATLMRKSSAIQKYKSRAIIPSTSFLVSFSSVILYQYQDKGGSFLKPVAVLFP